MTRKLRVGVLFGGRSGEHEVSLASARSIIAALDADKYQVVGIGISQDGRWLTQGDPMALLSQRAADPEPGASGSQASGGRELVPGATGRAFPQLDVIFPVLHGPYGEDGTVQGMLEMAGLPYVGCGVLASALAMDKIAAKKMLAAHGLPVVPWHTVKRFEWESNPQEVLAAAEAAFPYPLFVKPANLGSSIGISKASDRASLAAALTDAARYDRLLLIEEAVEQAREIECSVLGNDQPIASIPGEVVPSGEFYDYAAKYIDGRSELLIPAPIPAAVAERVRALAVRAFSALDCAGLARVDFLLSRSSGELYINELNTMPGFTNISMYPKLWEASGIPFSELVDRLIELGVERHADRSRSLTTYAAAMAADGQGQS